MKMKKTAAAVLAAMLAAGSFTAYAASDDVSAVSDGELQYGDSFVEGNLEYTVRKVWGFDDLDGTLEVKCARGKENTLTEVVIPSELKGRKVTSIVEEGFIYCYNLTKVTIPDSVFNISSYAFEGCKSLTTVTIPNSVTYIAFYAFKDCTSLIEVTIPNRITTIEDSTFYGCTSLESITIPNSVTSIAASAFYDCESLTDVYYSGTEEQWNNIKIAKENDSLINATIHFAETDPETSEPTTSDPTTSEPETSEPETSDPTTSEPETSEPETSDPTTSEPTTPEPDTSESDDPATPGDSDKQTVLDVTLKNLDSEKGLEGKELEKALFGNSGWTWEQVEKIEFTSKDLFSVSYKGKDGWVTLGSTASERAADDGIWNTEWTLNTADMAKDEKAAKLIAKDGTIDVSAKIYIKRGAEKPEDNNTNPGTGIAPAIAPVILAAGFVTVASKKRK